MYWVSNSKYEGELKFLQAKTYLWILMPHYSSRILQISQKYLSATTLSSVGESCSRFMLGYTTHLVWKDLWQLPEHWTSSCFRSFIEQIPHTYWLFFLFIPFFISIIPLGYMPFSYEPSPSKVVELLPNSEALSLVCLDFPPVFLYYLLGKSSSDSLSE